MTKDNKDKLIQQTTENITGWYLRNPIVRALAQFIPFSIGGATDVFLATKYEQLLEKRRKLFFEELDSGNKQLSPDLIASEDFLHCFDITLRAVHRSHREDKIRLFAKLFNAQCDSNLSVTTDEYEEFLGILDELSIKDIKILSAIEEYENRYYQNGRFAQEGPVAGLLHKVVVKHLEITEDQLTDDELRGAIIRLNRTGCYALMGWRKGPAKDCSLTRVYYRFKKLLMDEEIRLTKDSAENKA